MLVTFRRGLNTWPARLLFMFLVVMFVAWGVGSDILRLITGGMSDDSVATVGSRSIGLPELQDAYRRQLAQVMRTFGGHTEPTPEIRRGVAAQALQRLITQTALTETANAMGLVVPEAALRQTTFQIPAFHGANGQFDKTVFEQVLRNNDLTEPRFLALLRADMLQRQLLEPLRCRRRLARRADPRGLCLPAGEARRRRGRSAIRRRRCSGRADRGAARPLVRKPQGPVLHPGVCATSRR